MPSLIWVVDVWKHHIVGFITMLLKFVPIENYKLFTAKSIHSSPIFWISKRIFLQSDGGSEKSLIEIRNGLIYFWYKIVYLRIILFSPVYSYGHVGAFASDFVWPLVDVWEAMQ